MEKLVTFLKDLPHFKMQARGKLKLYREYMSSKEYVRGQIVCQ